ncbi:MAG: hypothetical protein ACPGLV_13155 [Bacteroidia bacterium]
MKWLLTFFALFTTIAVFAQQKHNNWLSLTLSPSSTKNTGHFAHNEFYSEFKRLPSLFGGVEFSKSVKPNLLLQTGLNLQNFRFYERGTTEGNNKIHEYTENFWYISLPINLIFKPSEYYLGAGLTISRFLQRRQVVEGTLNIINQPAFKGTLNNADYWMQGINIKAGRTWNISKRHSVFFEVYGLLNQPTFSSQGFNAFGVNIGFMYGYSIKSTARS